LMRDSKDPEGHVLAFGNETWKTFLEDIKTGRLGRP
jgi:hypothetical protein